MLIGDGEAADAKRRILERAGAVIVGEDASASLAIVALEAPEATVAALRGRGILVNTVDRPDLCDFMLPAIIDRNPVLVAIGSGGVSAGLAANLRQKLEQILPANLGAVAQALHTARPQIRNRWPDMAERRRAIGRALEQYDGDVVARVLDNEATSAEVMHFTLTSGDPDDLSLRQARALAAAERVYHHKNVPAAILDRARADAVRICGSPPAEPGDGLTIILEMAE